MSTTERRSTRIDSHLKKKYYEGLQQINKVEFNNFRERNILLALDNAKGDVDLAMIHLLDEDKDNDNDNNDDIEHGAAAAAATTAISATSKVPTVAVTSSASAVSSSKEVTTIQQNDSDNHKKGAKVKAGSTVDDNSKDERKVPIVTKKNSTKSRKRSLSSSSTLSVFHKLAEQPNLSTFVSKEEKEKPITTTVDDPLDAILGQGLPNNSEYISVWDDSLWGKDGNWKEVSDEVSNEASILFFEFYYTLEKVQNTIVAIKPSTIRDPYQRVREDFAITTSNVLSPSDDFSTQLGIDRMNCMPNYKKGTFTHDIAVVVSYMIVKEKISTTSKKLLVPPSIVLEHIDSLASGMATCFKQNCTVPQFILSAMVVIFDRSIVPLQLSLPIPKKTDRVVHYLHVDNNLEDFINIRSCCAAYSVPTGMKQRPPGWSVKLTMEVVAYCDTNKITLPYGDGFITNTVARLNRDQNRERFLAYKVYNNNRSKKRSMDPTKVAMDTATFKLYKTTTRAKNKHREYITKKEELEMGYMPVDVPHIANLALQEELIYNFIEDHKVGSRSKNSMSLKGLMNTSLYELCFIDIDGVTAGDPNKSVKDKIRCIAVYSMEKHQWLFLQKNGAGWGWITFNKGSYVPYNCGPGMRESMRTAWREMAKLVGSEQAFDVTVLEAQNKLRGFVGTDVLVDYNGCDTRGLVIWNNVIFENIKRFDFGQSVCFASNEHVERIFGPTSTRTALIHSINGMLETITNNLFIVGGKSWSQPRRGSICGPYLTCVEGELNYSDVVLDVQRLINLFVAIRTTYHHYVHILASPSLASTTKSMASSSSSSSNQFMSSFSSAPIYSQEDADAAGIVVMKNVEVEDDSQYGIAPRLPFQEIEQQERQQPNCITPATTSTKRSLPWAFENQYSQSTDSKQQRLQDSQFSDHRKAPPSPRPKSISSLMRTPKSVSTMLKLPPTKEVLIEEENPNSKFKNTERRRLQMYISKLKMEVIKEVISSSKTLIESKHDPNSDDYNVYIDALKIKEYILGRKCSSKSTTPVFKSIKDFVDCFKSAVIGEKSRGEFKKMPDAEKAQIHDYVREALTHAECPMEWQRRDDGKYHDEDKPKCSMKREQLTTRTDCVICNKNSKKKHPDKGILERRILCKHIRTNQGCLTCGDYVCKKHWNSQEYKHKWERTTESSSDDVDEPID